MNKVIMIGRLAADPELRTTQSGKPVATYRLAVNRRKDANGQQVADFFPCVAWGNHAEFVAKYLDKGMRIAVAGHLQTRSYDGQDGQKRYITEIIVDEHEFCDSKGAGGGNQDQSAQAQAANNNSGGGFTQVDDDDLPF